MGFLFFTLLLLPAILLCALISMLLEPFMPVLRPFVAWISQPAVFYTVCKVLTVVSLLLFMILMAVRSRWKEDGKLDQAYIHSALGLRPLWRGMVKLVLFWGPIWELAAAVFFYLCILLRAAGPLP